MITNFLKSYRFPCWHIKFLLIYLFIFGDGPMRAIIKPWVVIVLHRLEGYFFNHWNNFWNENIITAFSPFPSSTSSSVLLTLFSLKFMTSSVFIYGYVHIHTHRHKHTHKQYIHTDTQTFLNVSYNLLRLEFFLSGGITWSLVVKHFINICWLSEYLKARERNMCRG